MNHNLKTFLLSSAISFRNWLIAVAFKHQMKGNLTFLNKNLNKHRLISTAITKVIYLRLNIFFT